VSSGLSRGPMVRQSIGRLSWALHLGGGWRTQMLGFNSDDRCRFSALLATVKIGRTVSATLRQTSNGRPTGSQAPLDPRPLS